MKYTPAIVASFAGRTPHFRQKVNVYPAGTVSFASITPHGEADEMRTFVWAASAVAQPGSNN